MNGAEGPERDDILELRRRAQELKPTVFVGKEGVTSSVVRELSRQLEKQGLVKAKLLQSVEGELGEICADLARASGAVLVETRGRTAVFVKKPHASKAEIV